MESDRSALLKAAVGVQYLSMLCLFRRWRKKKERKNRMARRWYVRPINLERPIESEFVTLVEKMNELGDGQYHAEYFRMTPVRFNDLLRRVERRLRRAQTHLMPISPAFRLAMTIKILSSGDSLKNTAKSYHIGYDTARKILYETCDAIWTTLQPEFLHLPKEDDWKDIASVFWNRWQFPLCLGAIDGKHVTIKKPASAGSEYFNYKRDHSVVLMAVVDANYCFIYIDVGAYGRSNDAAVFGRSSFGKALMDENSNRLRIPGFARLPGSDTTCAHVFVGDDAFPIGLHLLKPYGGLSRTRDQRIFDYRLSRARGTAENAFGISTVRWRILHQPIACSPNNVDKIVKAIAVLHNYLIKTDRDFEAVGRYMPETFIDYEDNNGELREGSWRNYFPADNALQRLMRCKNRAVIGQRMRDRFCEFFQTEEGRVPWQDTRFRI